MGAPPLIDLKGIVIAAGWGPDGEVSSVDIAGYDEKRYRVADNPAGRQMFQLIKKAVAIQGRLAIENQQNVIYIEYFRHDDAERPAADPDK